MGVTFFVVIVAVAVTLGLVLGLGSGSASQTVTPTATPTPTPSSPPLPPTEVQETALEGEGVVGTARLGRAVSLSADGNTMAVGAYLDDGNLGATYVFVRNGVSWAQQGPKLQANDAESATPQQGQSVALSADGNTLAVGAWQETTGASQTGAAWVFVRSGTTWVQQGTKLVGTGISFAGSQGQSVALSDDGDTLAVGGTSDSAGVGATWIFTRAGTVWTQQGTKLVGTESVGTSVQGGSVSLDAAGDTLAVGGFGDNSGAGATWVFVRENGAWTQQGPKLVGSGAVGTDSRQGYSVSLAADGNTLATGAEKDDSDTGATWVFTRSAGVWTQSGTKIVGTGAVGPARQGSAVALTDDGRTLASGGRADNASVGAVWLYSLENEEWAQFGQKLVPENFTGVPVFGNALSLSSDGTTMAVAAVGNGGEEGAMWVYVTP